MKMINDRTNSTNIEMALEFYTAMANKDLSNVEHYIHDDIEFVGPLAVLQGKELYLEASRNYMKAFEKLTIRNIACERDHVMLVYDVIFPQPIGHLPAAGLMSINDHKIARIELFYDARPLVDKGAEIFSKD